MSPDIVKQLERYFAERDDVILAFLFGSRASGRPRPSSDWDIGVYFTPHAPAEIETQQRYSGEAEVRATAERIVGTDVDLVVLNRARPSLVFSILNSGTPLTVKDQSLLLNLLSRTHYEAVDFWNFVQDFWKIREQATSLTPEARAMLIEHLTFLENEFADLSKFQRATWVEYQRDRDVRRNLERWVENLVMAALDIAKIILASEKRDVPQTYRETLRLFAAEHLGTADVDRLAACAEMRNLIAHEYLDLRWERIQEFITAAGDLYPRFLMRVKAIVT